MRGWEFSPCAFYSSAERCPHVPLDSRSLRAARWNQPAKISLSVYIVYILKKKKKKYAPRSVQTPTANVRIRIRRLDLIPKVGAPDRFREERPISARWAFSNGIERELPCFGVDWARLSATQVALTPRWRLSDPAASSISSLLSLVPIVLDGYSV